MADFDSRDSSAHPTEAASSETGSARLQQAAKFLQDESIRNTPADRKAAFLQSKGLRNDQVQSLLHASDNTAVLTGEEATQDTKILSPAPETSEPSESSPPSQLDQKPSKNSIAAPSLTPSSTTRTSTAAQDLPPIITYPEFLLQPAKPPFVTLRSVLYTLYSATALAASVYGGNEYVVVPMLNALNGARHELAETVQESLRKLNEKLERTVSTIPPHPACKSDAQNSSESVDMDSVTSDPTELFHRDIGTQTSPGLTTHLPDTDSYFTCDLNTDKDVTRVTGVHLKRLENITLHLRGLLEDENSEKVGDDAVRARLSELQTYLDSLTYSSGNFGYLGNPIYNVYNNGDYQGNDGSGSATSKGENDAISDFKAEIRAIKGALLSTRNFPSGRPPGTTSLVGSR